VPVFAVLFGWRFTTFGSELLADSLPLAIKKNPHPWNRVGK